MITNSPSINSLQRAMNFISNMDFPAQREKCSIDLRPLYKGIRQNLIRHLANHVLQSQSANFSAEGIELSTINLYEMWECQVGLVSSRTIIIHFSSSPRCTFYTKANVIFLSSDDKNSRSANFSPKAPLRPNNEVHNTQ